jgi:hypothetical protein
MCLTWVVLPYIAKTAHKLQVLREAPKSDVFYEEQREPPLVANVRAVRTLRLFKCIIDFRANSRCSNLSFVIVSIPITAQTAVFLERCNGNLKRAVAVMFNATGRDYFAASRTRKRNMLDFFFGLLRRIIKLPDYKICNFVFKFIKKARPNPAVRQKYDSNDATGDCGEETNPDLLKKFFHGSLWDKKTRVTTPHGFVPYNNLMRIQPREARQQFWPWHAAAGPTFRG